MYSETNVALYKYLRHRNIVIHAYRLAQTLAAHPDLAIRLDGHTANTTDAKDPTPNQTLSEQRADAVSAYLVQNGIDPARLSTRGYGGSRPGSPQRLRSPQGPQPARRIRHREPLKYPCWPGWYGAAGPPTLPE